MRNALVIMPLIAAVGIGCGGSLSAPSAPDASSDLVTPDASVALATRLTGVSSSNPDLMNIFTSAEELVFDILLEGATPTEAYADWSVSNYFGEVIQRGSAIIETGEAKVSVNLGRLETGHYVVTASASGESVSGNFAVVTPYEQRKHLDDSPFAADTVMSWGLKGKFLGLIEPYARVIQLSGVTWIRDRLTWKDVTCKDPKSCNTKYSFGWYDRFTNASFHDKGIKVLDSFRGTPDWATSGTNLLPDDLTEIYDFAKNAGSHYGSKIGMWEVWNEPESVETGPGEGADKYAAFLKVASIGFHDSTAPNPLVTMGGLVSHKDPYQPYHDNLFENGIIDYVDVYNFHNHQGDVNVDGPYDTFSFDKNKAHLDLKNSLPGAATMPTWVTEAGGALKSYSTELDTYPKQIAQARYWITSAAMDLSTGVDKHFWFVDFPIKETPDLDASAAVWSWWGSFSPLMTPYAAYAAQAAMTEALGEAKYLGKVSGLPDGAKGYVFKDGDDTVLILWAASSSRASLSTSLDLQKPSGVQTDIMGRKRDIISSGGVFSLQLGPDPIYLRVSGTIPADAYTEIVYPPKSIVPKTLTSAQRIVLDQSFPEESRASVKYRFAYYLKTREPVTVKVTVYNFNATAITGAVTGSFDRSDYTVSEPQNVTVASRGKATLFYTVGAVGNLDPSVPAKLSFVGDFKDVGKTTPSVAYVRTLLPVDDLSVPDYYDSCDQLDGWDPRSGRWTIVDGKLAHEADSTSPFAYAKDKAVSDGIVSTKMKLMDGAWSGLAVRRNHTGDIWTSGGYFAYLRGDRLLSVYKGSASGGGAIAGPVIVDIDTKNNELELAFMMRGNRLDVYLNGLWYLGFNDDGSCPSGAVGVVGYNAKVTFDDFKIFPLP